MEWIYIATYNLVFQALIGWLGVNLFACIFQRLYLSHMTKLISAAMLLFSPSLSEALTSRGNFSKHTDK
jgi:hypothetical protein